MSKKLRISKLLIVAILLAVYSGIYTPDFLCFCNLNHSGLIASEKTNHHSKKKRHSENTGKEKHNNNDSKSKECCSNGFACCTEFTPFLIADLPKLIAPGSEFKLKTLNTAFSVHNLNSLKHEYLTSQFIAYQYKLPPPKIPDMRVFIQCFII